MKLTIYLKAACLCDYEKDLIEILNSIGLLFMDKQVHVLLNSVVFGFFV